MWRPVWLCRLLGHAVLLELRRDAAGRILLPAVVYWRCRYCLKVVGETVP